VVAAGSRMMLGRAAEERPGFERRGGAGFRFAKAFVCGDVVVSFVVVEKGKRGDRTGSVARGRGWLFVVAGCARPRNHQLPQAHRLQWCGVCPGVSRQARRGASGRLQGSTRSRAPAAAITWGPLQPCA